MTQITLQFENNSIKNHFLKIIELMKSDKKNRNGKITFVLPEKIGQVKVVNDVQTDTIKNILERI